MTIQKEKKWRAPLFSYVSIVHVFSFLFIKNALFFFLGFIFVLLFCLFNFWLLSRCPILLLFAPFYLFGHSFHVLFSWLLLYKALCNDFFLPWHHTMVRILSKWNDNNLYHLINIIGFALHSNGRLYLKVFFLLLPRAVFVLSAHWLLFNSSF